MRMLVSKNVNIQICVTVYAVGILIISPSASAQCYDTKYLKQPYTALEWPDLEIYHVTADTYCRTHCSGNSSCAAYSYNISTQTCYLSGEPIVRDDLLAEDNKQAYVKKRFFPELLVLKVVHTVYQDCQEAFEEGDIRSGELYLLRPESTRSEVAAVCQFDSSAGWTVIQRRLDGSVDFYRGYSDYIEGFGNRFGEYWIGLENIHFLTQRNRKLFIKMEDHDGQWKTANYSQFQVETSQSSYVLNIGGYSGDAGDSLRRQNGQSFTTFDHDVDSNEGDNCASFYEGAWWHESCFDSSLNGPWIEGGATESFAVGIIWSSWREHTYSLKTVYMMVTV